MCSRKSCENVFRDLKVHEMIYGSIQIISHTIEPAWPAILGQSSAHSFATGPVIADPFISPFGLIITPALSK
jgi:hypothetical protein